MESQKQFHVLLLGIIFDTKKRKILIGKRKRDPLAPEFSWTFIGGRPVRSEETDETLKKKIKMKTGLNVENLGVIFARTHMENPEFLSVYHLCEVVGGTEKIGDDVIELKWVKPEELEKHFASSFHPHLKEYILNLR